jgi:hypothetical protein
MKPCPTKFVSDDEAHRTPARSKSCVRTKKVQSFEKPVCESGTHATSSRQVFLFATELHRLYRVQGLFPRATGVFTYEFTISVGAFACFSVRIRLVNDQPIALLMCWIQNVNARTTTHGHHYRKGFMTDNGTESEGAPRIFAYQQSRYVPSILECGVLHAWFSLYLPVDNPVTLLTTNQLHEGRKDVSAWEGEKLCLLNEQELRLCLGKMVRVEVNPTRVSMLAWEEYMALDEDTAYAEELRKSFERGGVLDTEHYFLTLEQVGIENWMAVEVWDEESRAWCSLDGLLLFYKMRHLFRLQSGDLQISVAKLLDDLIRLHASKPNAGELITCIEAVQHIAAEKGDGVLKVLAELTAGVFAFDELGLVLNEPLT